MAKKKMVKVVNKQQREWHEHELEILHKRHEAALADHKSREPETITLVRNDDAEGAEALTFKNKFGEDIHVLPGDYYSEEAGMVLAASQVEGNSEWEVIK